ncbi:MAG: DUF2147 domain-containing protein [Dokdonella sp.]
MDHKTLLIAALLLSASLPALASNASPIGRWITFDEETQGAKALVEIHEHDGKFEGTVVRIIKSIEVDNPRCRACTGEHRDQPIVGMTILEGMHPDGDDWSGGSILDPENGKSYSCRMSLSQGGDELEVRGYIGLPLLGRTQVWKREPR